MGCYSQSRNYKPGAELKHKTQARKHKTEKEKVQGTYNMKVKDGKGNMDRVEENVTQ